MTCISEQENCPIVAFQVGTQSPGEDWTSAGRFSTSGNELYYTTNGDRPIAKMIIRISEPCLSNDQEKNYSRDYYILEKGKYYRTCKNEDGIDTRYKKLAQVDETTIYQENGVLAALSGLPQYDAQIHTDIKYSIWYRNYIDWNYECEEKSGKDRQYVVENILPVNKAVNREKSVLDLSISHCILSILFEIVKYVLLGIYCCSKKDEIEKGHTVISGIFDILYIVLHIFGVIYFDMAMDSVKDHINALSLKPDVPCSDQFVNPSLSYLLTDLAHTQISQNNGRTHSIIKLVFTVIHLLWSVFQDCSEC